MKHLRLCMLVILIIVLIPLSACGKAPASKQTIVPVKLEPIEGSEIKRVVLTDMAVKRLDIQTAPVQIGLVDRKQLMVGEVVMNPVLKVNTSTQSTSASNSNEAWVKVALDSSDLKRVDRSKPVLILPIARDTQVTGLPGNAVEVPVIVPAGATDEDLNVVYYFIERGAQDLAIGDRVEVELSLLGNGVKRIVIPYASVIYNQKGDTWVYTNPESLVYVRRPIIVDYIEGDQAFLTVGPPSGTVVVTVGAAELFGAETGVSK